MGLAWRRRDVQPQHEVWSWEPNMKLGIRTHDPNPELRVGHTREANPFDQCLVRSLLTLSVYRPLFVNVRARRTCEGVGDACVQDGDGQIGSAVFRPNGIAGQA